MKKHLIYICILWIVNISCRNDDNLPNIRPSATGEYTDARDGNTYQWVRLGKQEWMASNLKYGTLYYENEYDGPLADGYGDPRQVIADGLGFDFEVDFNEHGNLYTWEEALAACPEGWRLPTDEDWQNLETTLGMSAVTAASKGWRGKGVASLLRQDEGTGLGLQLAGNASLSGVPVRLYLNFLKEFGYYWTATEEENNGLQETTVFYRKIFGSRTTVYRDAAPLNILMRVRCVRDAQKD